MKEQEQPRHSEHHHGKHHHHEVHKSALITVTYTGKSDWIEAVVLETPLELIKMNAMRFFGIELRQEDRYVLQYNGADQKDETEAGCFELKEVTLKLNLKEEPNKGAL